MRYKYRVSIHAEGIHIEILFMSQGALTRYGNVMTERLVVPLRLFLDGAKACGIGDIEAALVGTSRLHFGMKEV